MKIPEEFQYNDEFFFDPLMRARAIQSFSAVWFALYSEKVSSEFRKHDDDARRLKAEFQWWGFRVVGLAVLALALAAIEPSFLHPAIDAGYLPGFVSGSVAALAGIAGVTSVLMGYFGMGFSGRKMDWLRARMLCERIRQWRWQYFCAHIPEITEASRETESKENYFSMHEAAFSEFAEKLLSEQEDALEFILSPKSANVDAVWADKNFKSAIQSVDLTSTLASPAPTQAEAATQILAAYRNVRIGAQVRYSRYLVKDSGSFTTHPATQKAWLHGSGIRLLFGIFGLHVLVLLGIFAFDMSHLAVKIINVSAVILALVALGLRAVEDGLRPAEHLGRIRGYLAEVSSIESAFDEAQTISMKHNLMITLERASYKEMVDFLQAGNRSTYVM